MARLPRVVAVDVPHHVTQRGNARQVIFGDDSDRLTYLDLLRQHCDLYRLSLLGYCLMSNHVHLVVVPRFRFLTPRKPGRRPKPIADSSQQDFAFIA